MIKKYSMKARTVLLMLLITFIGYTGFAHSHSDPGQNSKAKVYTLCSSGNMLDMAVMPSIELQVTHAVVITEKTDMPIQVHSDFVLVSYAGKHLYPPDSILHKQLKNALWLYERTDTLLNQIYLDRYRYKQFELIYVRSKQSGQHANKPRDKIIR